MLFNIDLSMFFVLIKNDKYPIFVLIIFDKYTYQK
jgi:hypothetical protein